jgi:glycosyltransferase involved in cell wall biosynthesis
MSKLSIVVPVYNERGTIRDILFRIEKAALPVGWTKEIIVVDDGSTDGTREALTEYKEPFKVIFAARNGGKGAALKLGFKAASGDYIIVQDADSEYDPGEYGALLQPIVEGRAEVVFGSRVLGRNKVPLSRVYFYGGLLVTKIYNMFMGTRLTDVATCYKVFPRKYLPELIAQPSNDFVYDVIEMTYVLGRHERILEVPVSYASRAHAEGKKINWKHGVRCFARILSLSAERPWRSLFLVGALFFAIFFTLYFSVSTLSSGDDHFFLFRFAQSLPHEGFFASFEHFKSIYISKIAQGNDYFMYYNFLFFLVLIPFTFIAPLFLGIKLYAVFVAAIAFALLYWCLKRFSIRNPFVWTIAILAITNVSSIWRFFLSRSYALAPSFLLLLVYFLYRRKWLGAAIVSFAYLYWNSSTFFLPACVALVYYVIERFYGERGDWKCLAGAVGGTLAAIGATYLVSSGFLVFLWDTVINIYWQTILGQKVHLAEGTELYPMDFFSFIQANAIMFAAFVTALATDLASWIGYRVKRHPAEDYFAGLPRERRYLQSAVLILTVLFFLGTVAASGRFGDYFTFFAALYVALSFDYVRRLLRVEGQPLVRRSLGLGLAVVLIYLLASNMLFLQRKLAFGQSPYEFYQVGSWLAENGRPGDVVFEANWSWFPQLYYWSPKSYYTEGLEPRFTYAYSPELYWKASHIPSDGYVCAEESCPDLAERARLVLAKGGHADEWAKAEGDRIAASLKGDFHASYVVSSGDYRFFNYILSNNPHFKLAVYDSQFNKFLFKVQ